MKTKAKQEILFTFNDTDKIIIGKDVHLAGNSDGVDWVTENILVAAEETIGTIPFGKHVCCINGQYYSFEEVPYGEEGAETINIKCVDNQFI